MTDIYDSGSPSARHDAEEARFARQEWLREARASFSPGHRQPCEVCGKYRSLAHAHHIVPLAMQGGGIPNHSFAWLCPTHHAAVHLFIHQVGSKRGAKLGRWLKVLMLEDMPEDEMMAVWALFNRFKEAA